MGDGDCKFYRTLYELVKVINSSLEPGEVLNKIAEQVSLALEVKGSSIRLLDRRGKYLLPGAFYGLSQGYLRKGRVDIAKSKVDAEVLKGEPVYIENVCEDSRFQYPEAAKAECIASLYVVPLMVEGKSIGVIRVYSKTKRAFSADEAEFLSLVANLSAIAIENARLHQALKSDYELLTAYEYQVFED